MKNRMLFQLAVLCLFCAASQAIAQKRFVNKIAASPATVSSNTLPIRRVILYSNGVAYIERRGIVSGKAEINLSFKQSQVDDVLKSMVVLDLGQGRIGAVSYNSSAPPSSKMAEIPFSVEAQTGQTTGIASVLSQLQGAKVAVNSTKGIVNGSILTVEKRQVTLENKSAVMKTFLVIASETGELSTFDLDEVRSVKLLEEGTRRDVNEFANATASTRRRDAKTITVTSEGGNQREMVVSYTVAAPVWKTTYRVVLDQEGKPFFQGWAIVDNVSDEDWSNVQLSLVSGSPISFIQPIQQPFYRYRPVVPIPNDLKLSPQVYEEGTNYGVSADTIAGIVTDQTGAIIPNATVTITNNSNGQQFSLRTNGEGNFSQSGLSAGNYTLRIYSSGFKMMNVSNVSTGSNLKLNLQVGTVSETVTVEAESLGNNFTTRQLQNLPINGRRVENLIINGNTGAENNILVDGQESNNYRSGIIGDTTVSDALLNNKSGIDTAATGGEIGDLFEYKIEQPITVNHDRSALIPIVQTKMDGERVSVYNEAVRRDRPMGGMKLINTTSLTLEGGSMTILDKDAYAGEALMERLKPKEERLISYALDLGTSITVKQESDISPAKLVKAVNGILQIHYFRDEKKTYALQNQTDRPRVVYIEYPVRQGWELAPEMPKPEIKTQRFYRFRVELAAFDKKEFVINEQQALMDSYTLTNITRPQLEIFLSRRYIDEAMKQRLEKLIDLRMQINQIAGKLQALDQEESKISDDQKRLRENIEALSKTPEAKVLIERYIAKVNDQETRLEAINKERQTLIQERETVESQLATEIKNFELK